MIYQNDPEFEHVDNLEGCCVFASAHAILELLGRLADFTTENMLEWLQKAKEDGVIVADDFLKFPQKWADIICDVPNKVLHIDRILPADFASQGVSTVDYLYNLDTKFHHFVRGWQKGGKCLYDPLNYNGMGSFTARGPNTYVESKRGFQLA
jgi:hypothetical protein